MYLLDTDHVSLDQRGNALVAARLKAVGPADVAVSIITVEEQLRGWLAVVRAAKNGNQRTAAYNRLRIAVEYFATMRLLDYDRAADEHFEALRQAGVRIGTQDLRIAAIALAQGAIVVTRNTRDFGQIPRLSIVDWSAP
jgi:tRNA(fMet)-specific endonuclease VapC